MIRLILSLKPVERLHRRRQLVERLDAEIRILLPERLHHVAEIAFRDDVVGFAREEPAPHHADRHVEMRHPLGDGFSPALPAASALQPGQRQCRAAESAEKFSS